MVDDQWRRFDVWMESRTAYVKTILTLSSGAFVISIATVGNWEPVRWRELLLGSWALFTVSLILMVFSMRARMKGAFVALRVSNVQARAETQSQIPGIGDVARDMARKPIRNLSKRANKLGAVSDGFLEIGALAFVGGAVLLLVFAIANAPMGSADRPTEAAQAEEKETVDAPRGGSFQTGLCPPAVPQGRRSLVGS